MSDKQNKFVPLSLIASALDEAIDVWNQYIDTEEMKFFAIPEDPEEVEELYFRDEELEKLLKEDTEGRFVLMPSEEEVVDLDIMYNLSSKEGLRSWANKWCMEKGFSVFDDLNIIGRADN